jgi:8-amino-7-oxononanoate synthase
MNFSADTNLTYRLEQREEENSLRKLTTPHNIIDFCSNDYLGFAKSGALKAKILRFSKYLEDQLTVGSTGSRLISGNSALIESLESFIASYHNATTGLIFNSGYDANIGLFSSVIRKEDTIIFDELVHASIHDGMRLSKANAISFKHNDIEDFKSKFELATGTIYVAVESVYSMDGDVAPLKEIADICVLNNANLIVDEAHATGVIGAAGKGLVADLALENKVFARVHTFGKALGCHGAIILGSELLRNYLVNFARSFIYTTALPFHTLVSIKSAYDLLSESEEIITDLETNIQMFKKLISEIEDMNIIESNSPIQSIIISGNGRVKEVATSLQNSGFDIRPILKPTVPEGKERLRICIHSFNTEDEIKGLAKAIEEILK